MKPESFRDLMRLVDIEVRKGSDDTGVVQGRRHCP